jgi:hypothetical protein
MVFVTVLRVAARFGMEATQPSEIVSEYAVHDVKVVSEGDAAEFPSISVERRVALAECDRLRLCQPVATIGAPEENR